MQQLQICIGPIIRIGRESWCLPYAGFFFWLAWTLGIISNSFLNIAARDPLQNKILRIHVVSECYWMPQEWLEIQEIAVKIQEIAVTGCNCLEMAMK